MLEKPELQDQLIISHLQNEYGFHATQVTFLPIGADVNTAVYRVVSVDEEVYFLKLRKGAFDEITVILPQFLKSQGIQAIIAPLETRVGGLWASLGDFKTILYPFVEGKNGYEVTLSDKQWVDFGITLKRIHTTPIPSFLRKFIPQEKFSSRWRNMVKTFQDQIEYASYGDPVATKFAASMRERREEIDHIVRRAGQLGHNLRSQSSEFILCHSDIHPGNLLVSANEHCISLMPGKGGEVPCTLYIVDWDNPIFAPKERDLMFIGAGMGMDGEREEGLFYRGYGQTQVNQTILAYYRYERIVQDIAVYCEQLLLTDKGGEDREQSYRYFSNQFLPGNVVEIAYKTDKRFIK